MDKNTPSPTPDDPPVMNPMKGKTGVRRVINAFFYSLAGIRAAWHHENAFRQEVALAAFLLPVAFLVPMPGVERALLAGSVLMVLVVELLNSAVESAIDRISPEHHVLSGRAKDVGSAAVLVALLTTFVVWACVLPDRIAPLL